MTIPAEQYTQRLMLVEQLKKYVYTYEAFLRRSPPRFDGKHDPWERLATGLLRADDLHELGQSVEHFRRALEATVQLDHVHYPDYQWGSHEPKKGGNR